MLADADDASSSSVSESKARRGFWGLGSMRSTGSTRTPRLRWDCSGESRLTIAGDSSRSSESRRAAAARKSVLAKFDHLPCQLAIRASGIRVRWRTT